jgi:hypothetical protein
LCGSAQPEVRKTGEELPLGASRPAENGERGAARLRHHRCFGRHRADDAAQKQDAPGYVVADQEQEWVVRGKFRRDGGRFEDDARRRAGRQFKAVNPPVGQYGILRNGTCACDVR